MRTKDAPATYQVKQAEDGSSTGEFEALVAVFGNVDYVGDRVMPGAFAKSLERWAASPNAIPVIYSHAHDDPNALLGVVIDAKETDEGLWVRGMLDLDAPAAASVHRAMQARALTKFSFAYDVLAANPDEADANVTELTELDLIEVGPTVVPANVETDLLAVKAAALKAGRVLSAKNEDRLRQARDLLGEVLDQLASGDADKDSKAAIRSHSTATSTGTWDANAAMGRLSTAEGYRAASAWVDPDADPDTRAAYRFPHHEVDGRGRVGSANLTAASAGIGILNGGRGGTAIPAADRQGVYNHLARHLRDGDREPPPLSGTSSIDPLYLRARAMAVGVPTPPGGHRDSH